MTHCKKTLLALLTLSAMALRTEADDTTPKSTSAKTNAVTASTNSVAKAAAKQADVASKTAKFETTSKAGDAYKTALDAHALDAALKAAGKDGAFKGKVTKIFEPRGGFAAIVNFDADYKTAMTALLKKENFDKFPALTNLVDKEVLVTGKFVDYQGRAEVILTNTAQIKLVQ